MKTPVEDLPDPLADNYASGWEQLLGRSPETGSEEERRRWHTRTLPLMARPELGLPWDLQDGLLKECRRIDIDSKWLVAQRLRLITDAIVASDMETGKRTQERESQETANTLAEIFEKRQREVESKDSPWKTIVAGSQADVQ